MRIGLIDVDGHNFPNVALMKIASWHRQQGDTVEWAMPMFGHYDRIELLRPDILYRILTVVAKTFDCPARLGQQE